VNQVSIKTEAEIESMRQGGRMLAQVLETVVAAVRPGITAAELSKLAGREIERLGGEAAFLGHEGFPAPICISINDAVVHGIPGRDVLREGDIVGLDFGVRYQGMLTDGAVTVPVGQVTAEAQRLLDATIEARAAGVAAARAGNRVGDVSAAIERVLRREKLGVIQELVGHGVGYDLWEEPNIPNYGKAHSGPRLKPGMTLAIEPMATLGDRHIVMEPDGWTVRTKDGSLATQFEHTVLITPEGPPEILTQV
jgi:methionyl aminopeptidase